jgi:hypothetical protein
MLFVYLIIAFSDPAFFSPSHVGHFYFLEAGFAIFMSCPIIWVLFFTHGILFIEESLCLFPAIRWLGMAMLVL